MFPQSVQIVGAVKYDARKGVGYWIIRNSWGEDWEYEGYTYIKFGAKCLFFQHPHYSYYTIPKQIPTLTHWILSIEGIHLVFRFNPLHPPKSGKNLEGADRRIAFREGIKKNFGNSNIKYANEDVKELYSDGNWVIREETGVLCIRNGMTAKPDYRYAFFPGSGKNINFGNNNQNVGEFGNKTVLYSGRRWSINVEFGILVFRDNISPGDHRYAFYQDKLDMWK